MQMIIFGEIDSELRYLEFDFSGPSAYSILIKQSLFEAPESTWIGSNSQNIGNIQIFESYSAMTSKVYQS